MTSVSVYESFMYFIKFCDYNLTIENLKCEKIQPKHIYHSIFVLLYSKIFFKLFVYVSDLENPLDGTGEVCSKSSVKTSVKAQEMCVTLLTNVIHSCKIYVFTLKQ